MYIYTLQNYKLQNDIIVAVTPFDIMDIYREIYREKDINKWYPVTH